MEEREEILRQANELFRSKTPEEVIEEPQQKVPKRCQNGSQKHPKTRVCTNKAELQQNKMNSKKKRKSSNELLKTCRREKTYLHFEFQRYKARTEKKIKSLEKLLKKKKQSEKKKGKRRRIQISSESDEDVQLDDVVAVHYDDDDAVEAPYQLNIDDTRVQPHNPGRKAGKVFTSEELKEHEKRERRQQIIRDAILNDKFARPRATNNDSHAHGWGSAREELLEKERKEKAFEKEKAIEKERKEKARNDDLERRQKERDEQEETRNRIVKERREKERKERENQSRLDIFPNQGLDEDLLSLLKG
jgi:hypothetical protein